MGRCPGMVKRAWSTQHIQRSFSSCSALLPIFPAHVCNMPACSSGGSCRKASGTGGLLFVTTECVSHPSRHCRCLGPELLKRFRGQLFSDGFDGAWADLFFAAIPKC